MKGNHMQNTSSTRLRVSIALILSVALAALLLLGAVLAWLWLQWNVITERYPFFTDTLSIAVFLLPVVLVASWSRASPNTCHHASRSPAGLQATARTLPRPWLFGMTRPHPGRSPRSACMAIGCGSATVRWAVGT